MGPKLSTNVSSPGDSPPQTLQSQDDLDLGKSFSMTPHAGDEQVEVVTRGRRRRHPQQLQGRSTAHGANAITSYTRVSNDGPSGATAGCVEMSCLPPERASVQSPCREHSKERRHAGSHDNGKSRRQPDGSRLRAPGWGREAVITSIPPAPRAAVTQNVTIAADSTLTASATAFLPSNLLTPVTEAPTVDERSSSGGTRGTRGRSAASSEASALQERSGKVRGGTPGSSPLCRARRRCPSAASAGNSSTNRQETQRATWDNDGARSGSRRGASGSSGHRLASEACSSAYSSPCSATGNLVSKESRASGRSSAEADAGYVAAMGRRARSVARHEAARRMAAAARARENVRPSTPITERARWGKGRETHAESKRRDLLQRRSEYAKELKRKAKVRRE